MNILLTGASGSLGKEFVKEFQKRNFNYIFFSSGQAKITVNPILHRTQYPRLYPLKLPENEEQEIISSWLE